jgi:hypothetical protein
MRRFFERCESVGQQAQAAAVECATQILLTQAREEAENVYC